MLDLRGIKVIIIKREYIFLYSDDSDCNLYQAKVKFKAREGLNMQELRDRFLRLQRRAKELASLLAGYGRMEGDPSSNPYVMEALLLKMDKLKAGLELSQPVPNFSRWMDDQRLRLKPWKEKFKSDFGRKLEGKLEAKGLKLRGQYPNLYAGLYSLKPNFLQGEVAISWGPEPVKKVRLNSQEVIDSILRFEEGLKGSQFDPNSYLTLLRKAYRRALKGEEGERAPIIEVLGELAFLRQGDRFRSNPTKSNYTGYGRAQFGYDLYRLKKLKGEELSLWVATFEATKRRDKVVFVPDDEERGTRYAYLSIARQNRNQTALL